MLLYPLHTLPITQHAVIVPSVFRRKRMNSSIRQIVLVTSPALEERYVESESLVGWITELPSWDTVSLIEHVEVRMPFVTSCWVFAESDVPDE